MEPEVERGPAPLHAVALIDVGLRRSGQEDALHVGGDLIVVADGMGGHQGGEIASAAAVEAVVAALTSPWTDVDEQVQEAVAGAHAAVVERGRAAGAWDAGSTVALAWRPGGTGDLIVAHVGDSRVGWCTPDGFLWLTEDHNEAAELVALGELTVEQAYALGLQHSLARCLGVGQAVAPRAEVTTFDVSQGGRLLVCSDGLCGYVADELVSDAMVGSESPEEAVTTLGAMARAVGAPDNVSIVVADVPAATPDPVGPTH